MTEEQIIQRPDQHDDKQQSEQHDFNTLSEDAMMVSEDMQVSDPVTSDNIDDSYSHPSRSRRTSLDVEADSDSERQLATRAFGAFFLPFIAPTYLYLQAYNDHGMFGKKACIKAFNLQATYLGVTALLTLLFGTAGLNFLVVYALASLYGAKKASDGKVWNPVGSIGLLDVLFNK